MIWFSSDLHFNHDKAFIYEPRGCSSIEEMNTKIVDNFNSVIRESDTLYLLGDNMLGGSEKNEDGMRLLNSLHGNKILIAGNHDGPSRKRLYIENDYPIYDALAVVYYKIHFYLSHYPTITTNLQEESIKQAVVNLHGHTHSKSRFYNDIPLMYNVGVDAHDLMPVSIDTVIEDIKNKIKECKGEL